MTTRRVALGGLALLAVGIGAARDGSRGWRLELKAARPADAVAAIPLLLDHARQIGAPAPEIARRGPVRLVLIWRAPIDPDDAEAVFSFLPRFGVHEMLEVSPMVSSSFSVPGARARKDESDVQLGARLLDGHDLETATASRDRQGLPAVLLRLSAPGARKAARLTPRLLGHRVLVAVGGRPVSAPLVVGPFRRRTEIGGLFTPESAAEAAAAITAGAVAERMKLVDSRPLRSGE